MICIVGYREVDIRSNSTTQHLLKDQIGGSLPESTCRTEKSHHPVSWFSLSDTGPEEGLQRLIAGTGDKNEMG